ncbi:unnamed protein product, partial [Aphanomyces euteiches]
ICRSNAQIERNRRIHGEELSSKSANYSATYESPRSNQGEEWKCPVYRHLLRSNAS